MRQLSPLLQTIEIKNVLDTAVQERTREERDRVSTGVPTGAYELYLIREIISGNIEYNFAVTEHGLSNNVIVDRLLRYKIISDDVAQVLKRELRTKNTPRNLIPHT